MTVEVMTTTAVGEVPALDGDPFPLAARVAGTSISKTMAVSARIARRNLRRIGSSPRPKHFLTTSHDFAKTQIVFKLGP